MVRLLSLLFQKHAYEVRTHVQSAKCCLFLNLNVLRFRFDFHLSKGPISVQYIIGMSWTRACPNNKFENYIIATVLIYIYYYYYCIDVCCEYDYILYYIHV